MIMRYGYINENIHIIQNMYLYAYQLTFEDNVDEDNLEIRMFGIESSLQKDVCLRIRNFRPFLFVEVKFPDKYQRPAREKILCDYFFMIQKELLKMLNHFHLPRQCAHRTLRGNCPRCWQGEFSLVRRQCLYFGYEQEKELYIMVYFPTDKLRQQARWKWNQKSLSSLGVPLCLFVHQYEASVTLQFITSLNIPITGWIKVESLQSSNISEKISDCDQEYFCSAVRSKFERCTSEEEVALGFPHFRILSFDIEAYSHVPSRMPNASCKEDVCFQISCVSQDRKVILTLVPSMHSKISLADPTCEVVCFDNEQDMLTGFRDHVHAMNPHILIGYNIFSFDLPFMLERLETFHPHSLDRFSCLGMLRDKKCAKKNVSWKSSAYSNQNFVFLDMEGRIFVDLLPIVKRDYKLDNYKLKTVSQHFIGDTKDPLTPKDLFEAYKRFCLDKDEKASKMMGEVAKYCIQDSQLVLSLFHKLQCWIGLCEMSKLCCTSVLSLFTQGQQLKVYSQVYYKCFHEGIMVQSSESVPALSSLQTKYTGATVFPPEAGLYDWVIPFDFSSLYPTTIIAYNIDYSTYVPVECIENGFIPKEACHEIQWTEEEDQSQKRFYFKKTPEGVLPSLLRNLLQQRKETKKRMQSSVKTDLLYQVLDKRQLAYKVSANSMYGAMGVERGYLPFMPGAQCTTAMGRLSIQKAADFVQQRFRGRLIYGDSVTEDTPILFRIYNKWIDIQTIPSLMQKYFPHSHWETMGEKEYISSVQNHVQVWTSSGWTMIHLFIRHATQKDVFQVSTPKASVCVTADHSLLTLAGEKISPRDIITAGTHTSASPLLLLHHCFPAVEGMDSLHDNNGLDRFAPLVDSLVEEFTLSPAASDDLNAPTAAVQGGWVLKLEQGDCDLPIGLLNASQEIRQQFWDTLMTGLSARADMTTTAAVVVVGHIDFVFPCSKKAASQWCFFAAQLLFNFVVLDPYSFRIDLTPRLSYQEQHDYRVTSVKQIVVSSQSHYVYDLTTASGTFQAGIGTMIVHNTDSIYMHFPHQPTDPSHLWKLATDIERNLVSLFPPPMKLVFEEKLYKKFFILTKKRYMALTCNEDGSQDDNLTIRGVLLARRDNCRWIRGLYEELVRFIMTDTATLQQAVELVNTHVLMVCQRTCALASRFVVTKMVSDGYKIRELPSSPKKRLKRLKDMNLSIFADEKMIRERSYPAHVQLAEKMKRRGQIVETGSRLEYLVVQPVASDPKAHAKKKMYEKIEDPAYASHHSDLLRIDYLYYFKNAIQPIDQILYTVFKQEQIMKRLHEIHYNFARVMHQLHKRFASDLVFQPAHTPDQRRAHTLDSYFSKQKKSK